MNKRSISAILKAVFRPIFSEFDTQVEGLKEESRLLGERVNKIEQKVGLDRAMASLDEDKGEADPKQ